MAITPEQLKAKYRREGKNCSFIKKKHILVQCLGRTIWIQLKVKVGGIELRHHFPAKFKYFPEK